MAMNFKKNIFHKQKKEPFGKIAKKMATQRPFVRIDFLKNNILVPIVSEYLMAAYSQDITALPMKHMTEDFYYTAQAMIAYDIQQNGKRILSGSPKIEECICDVIYNDIATITKLKCKITFLANGIIVTPGSSDIPFQDHLIFQYGFIKDDRMGWLLNTEEATRVPHKKYH